MSVAIENPNGVKSVYANNTFVSATSWDIRLTFSELIPDPLDGPVTNELRANVVLTPKQAKALAMTLSGVVQKYEEQLGEIVWPDQLNSNR